MKDEKKGEFLKAMKESLGIITSACQSVGVSRTLYYTWRRTDEDFASKVDEIKQEQIDFVEGQLLTKIQDGDTTAIIFYLKTIGKVRGYTEKNMPDPNKQEQGMDMDEQKRVVARIAGEKSALKKKLVASGKYSEILEPQLDIAAELIVKRKMLNEEMRSTTRKSVTTEISREGNERMILDPRQALYKDITKLEQDALAALGMNAKCIVENEASALDEFLSYQKPE